MATVLLEIGTEELPARYVPPALAQLAELARARFGAERIAVEDVQTWGTPRRLAVLLTGVAAEQAPAVREVRGPAVQEAFAPNGEPSQALLGFARSHGITVSDLRLKRLDGGEYMVAIFRDAPRPTLDLLPRIFPDLVTGLTFPHTMRWGESPFRFARPIRWLVALLDDQVIPVTIGEVQSGRASRGHRFLAAGAVDVPHAREYRRIMDESHVIVAPDDRRAALRAQLDTIAQQEHAHVLDDGTLLDATTFLVEYPTVVRCAFDPAFLALPEVILLRVLRDEQGFFPLAGADGALLPAFFAVRNGDKAYLSTVRDGYESVARAKLLDALFFYEQDARRPLIERVEELRGVVFQERLGSLHDKVGRLQRLAGELGELLGIPAVERPKVERAALLCKADLVTSMVIEHPELQGIMGGLYARRNGEPELVATAIGEHAHPRHPRDPIPATLAGRALALADKLDTLAACFAVGLAPTGSADPYGLQRDAQGVVRMLAEGGHRVALSSLIARAVANLPVGLLVAPAETRRALEAFFQGRTEALLAAAGIPPALIRAVGPASDDTPADALRRAQTLQRHQDDPRLDAIMRVATRLQHISRDVEDAVLAPALLTAPAEHDLSVRYQEVAPQADFFTERAEYDSLFALLAALVPAIDRFFSEVMVMVDDPALRQARLALLARLAQLFRRLVDPS